MSAPSGTVTFLFTDIEGSTRLAQEHRDHWEALRARHHAILHDTMQVHEGHVFEIIGDAFCVAFATAIGALNAAVEAQRLLHDEHWDPAPIRVRMGIHTGTAQVTSDGGYQGYISLARAQRLMSAGHGGQVLVSLPTEQLVRTELPSDMTLQDMGERRLKDLILPERIYQLVIPGLPADFPPIKTLDAYRHNLPAQLTSFVGRQKEVAEVTDAVRKNRVVTLTGSGGTGKTRLALQVGAELLDQFPDGVWFIDLSSLTNPDYVPETALSAFGAREQPGRTAQQTLLDHVREKDLLIILDNCEHLVEASARLVDSLQNGARATRLIATSREALGVRGEATWRVPSLSVPDVASHAEAEHLVQYEAVQLFIERALLVQPRFTVTNDNAPAVARICVRLDGIPLAIELAAARLNALTPDLIAARLDDRFLLLTGKSRTVLPRHQTLRAAIDWSYDLLSEAEQTLLQRLSVFAGGWTLEAAEQVCAFEGIQSSILDLLTSLVDKSLVAMSDSSGSARYRILETTRQYAREKFDAGLEGEDIRGRHADYFAALAERVEMDVGRGEFDAVQRVAGDQDNIVMALEWALGGAAVETGARLAAAMGEIWDTQVLQTLQSHWARRARLHQQALPRELKARVLAVSARAEWIRNNPEQARRFGLEALAIFREIGDNQMVGRTLINLAGSTVGNPSDYEQAKIWQAEALAIAREGGYVRLESFALTVLGEVARGAGDYATARTTYEECLRHATRIGDSVMESISLYNLSLVCGHEQDYPRALDAGRQAVKTAAGRHQDGATAYFLTAVAGALAGMGQAENAARLFGASEALLEGMGSRIEQPDLAECERSREIASTQAGVDRFEGLLAEGRAMTLEQAVSLALMEP